MKKLALFVEDPSSVNVMQGVPGGADNTQALQDAHDALPDSGGTIVIPRAEGGSPFSASSRYYCAGKVTFTKPVVLQGEGHDSSVLKYTGSGAFITQGIHQLALRDVGILGETGPNGELYTPGSVGVKMEGLLKTHGARIAMFDSGVYWKGGYYHKFIDSEFDRNRVHLANFSANNVSFIGCRFAISEQVLHSTAGRGPVLFSGCAFESFEDRAITRSGHAGYDVVLTGCYMENSPDLTTPKGIGTDTSKFDSGVLVSNGEGTVTITGSMLNTSGVIRVINHSGNAFSKIVSQGNNIIVYDTAPQNTLDYYAYLGTESELMMFDFAQGNTEAQYTSNLGSNDEALYRDPFTGQKVGFL